LDERFDPLLACQPKTEQVALALEVNMKIKKGTALAFSRHPVGQLPD